MRNGSIILSDRNFVDHYREVGYAVLRRVFDPSDIREMAAAFDRVYAAGLAHSKSYRHKNTFFQLAQDPALGRVVRLVQWPSYFDPVLARIRIDPRMFEILAPLLGCDIKQIINQLHWKPPGAKQVEFGFHQDIRFRRPRSAYRNPESAYVQTAIAVDTHRKENGAIAVYPHSHRLGELSIPGSGRVCEQSLRAADLQAVDLDPGSVVHLELDPGDVAIWNLFMVHGSGPNDSPSDRRVYINGYVRAEDCDRGEWAFRDGVPCDVGEPVLVHYEELYTRPGPYYVEAD